jgi:glycosyltransferase involved in cell wall biosynthesis
MNIPHVTILMPAYNTAPYIAEAIQSVLAQDFTDFELLIVDDGSTDNTIQVIKSFTDPRIRLIRQGHAGIAAALNRGLQEAQGEYIARFDADDICLPGRLCRQVDFLESHPDYVICGGEAEYISDQGEHLFHFRCAGYSHEDIMARLYVRCPFIHSAVMYRRHEVLRAGGYSLDAHNFEDYLLWVQLKKLGRYCNLPYQLIKVRFNPASVTIDEKWRGRRFRQLKSSVIRQGYVTPEQEKELAGIIQSQDLRKIKEGAYYALCGKKFLVNNHQPHKARTHLSRAIRVYPLRWDNYALYVLSYFPQPVIGWLHRKNGNKI